MSEGVLANTAILVVGTHRSGTSATAGVLQRVGVELGSQLLGPAPDNPKGFFEHTGVVSLHGEILPIFDATWDDPRSLPEGWEHDPRLEPFRQRLKAILSQTFAGVPLWGVKDPRLCRLLPLWFPVLRELEVTPKALLVVRNPSQVSASLGRRNKMPPEQAAMLWLSDVLAAERATRGLPRTIILYEDLLRDWPAEIRRVSEALRVDFFALTQSIKAEIADFIDFELQNHREPALPLLRAPQNIWVSRLYDAMVRWRREAISPAPLCDRARRVITLAELAAEPIAAYMRAIIRTTSADAIAQAVRANKSEASTSAAIARAEQAEASAAEARARAEQAEANAAEANVRAGQTRHELLHVRKELAGVIENRDVLLQSTTWKATQTVRALGSRLPPEVRQVLRGGAKLFWRAVTSKLTPRNRTP